MRAYPLVYYSVTDQRFYEREYTPRGILSCIRGGHLNSVIIRHSTSLPREAIEEPMEYKCYRGIPHGLSRASSSSTRQSVLIAERSPCRCLSGTPVLIEHVFHFYEFFFLMRVFFLLLQRGTCYADDTVGPQGDQRHRLPRSFQGESECLWEEPGTQKNCFFYSRRSNVWLI